MVLTACGESGRKDKHHGEVSSGYRGPAMTGEYGTRRPLRERMAGTDCWRLVVQWGFFLWILVIGVRFGLFVRHFEPGGAQLTSPARPAWKDFSPSAPWSA